MQSRGRWMHRMKALFTILSFVFKLNQSSKCESNKMCINFYLFKEQCLLKLFTNNNNSLVCCAVQWEIRESAMKIRCIVEPIKLSFVFRKILFDTHLVEI